MNVPLTPDAANAPAKASLWAKIIVGITLFVLIGGIVLFVLSVRSLFVGVPMAYHKQWAFNFISDYHQKTGEWPRSWDEIERTIDTSSPHKFSDIKKNVSVKWDNLGVIITDPKDYYIRTSPDTKWQGEDWNRDMIQLIKDRQVNPKKSQPGTN